MTISCSLEYIFKLCSPNIKNTLLKYFIYCIYQFSMVSISL